MEEVNGILTEDEMSKLYELRKQFKSVSAELRVLLDKDKLTDEEDTLLIEKRKEINSLRARIDTQIELEEMEGVPAREPTKIDPETGLRMGLADYPGMRAYGEPDEVRSGGRYGSYQTGSAITRVEPASDRRFRAMFPDVEMNTGGFGSFKEFARNVGLGLVDDRLKRSLIEGQGDSGGFVVPTEYSRNILDVSLEDEIVRKRATVYPMKSNELKVPGTVIGNHSSSLYGGVIAYWKSEGSTLTESVPTFRNVTLKANKLTVLGKASNEWAADNISGDAVARAFTGTLGFNMDDSFISGTGAGEPLGILNAECTVEVSAEGGQSASTIVYENLANMVARIHPASFGKSVWIAHTSTIPQLLTLGLAVGTGGSHVPVMKESNGKFSILTRPVIFTEKAQTLGTAGDIMLCDLSQYIIGLRSDIRLDTSKHVAFSSDELYYRGLLRVDGQPAWNEKMTLKDNTTTVGPFVILEDR